MRVRKFDLMWPGRDSDGAERPGLRGLTGRGDQKHIQFLRQIMSEIQAIETQDPLFFYSSDRGNWTYQYLNEQTINMIELTMYLHLSKFTLKNTKDGPKYRRIKTEEKAKFVTVIWGTYLIAIQQQGRSELSFCENIHFETAATTFAFSSVFILLICPKNQ